MFLPSEPTERYDRLIRYAEHINRLNGGSATAVVVIHKDKIVTEHYSGAHSQLPGADPVTANSQFHVASVRKSFIGLVVALALHEKKIRSIDDLAADYLINTDKELLLDTSIRHLLTHTHGLLLNKEGRTSRSFKPGTGWMYNNEGIRLLSEIIRNVTGNSVEQWIRERMIEPMGLTQTGWAKESTPNLVPVITNPESEPDPMLGDLFVSARDLAMWGYLHLKNGFFAGKQVVPEQVIRMATIVQSPAALPAEFPQQGFLWYVKGENRETSEIGERVPHGSFQIIGMTGPLLLVIPERELVVVRMYNKLYNYGGDRYLQYFREFGNKVMECLEGE